MSIALNGIIFYCFVDCSVMSISTKWYYFFFVLIFFFVHLFVVHLPALQEEVLQSQSELLARLTQQLLSLNAVNQDLEEENNTLRQEMGQVSFALNSSQVQTTVSHPKYTSPALSSPPSPNYCLSILQQRTPKTQFFPPTFSVHV